MLGMASLQQQMRMMNKISPLVALVSSSSSSSSPFAAASRALASTTSSHHYKAVESGEKVPGADSFVIKTKESYRVGIRASDGKQVSPWHHIPLFPSKTDHSIVNYVNEIPRGSTAKMEVATKEQLNPIKQDVKKGALRHYPFESLVNYGCLPQTWEDPKHKDSRTGLKGDNDPVDVCEIGSRVALTGEVYPVKVLGILGMIDEGEMDYKVLAIAKDDPLAPKINSVEDIEKVMPGKIAKIVSWFKYYKVPDGKPVNSFAFDEKAQDKDFAIHIVNETHEHWKHKENLKKSGLWVD